MVTIKNKEINYYIWDDEPIKANYHADIKLPNGGNIHSIIGQITIEKGDIIYIDYGSSFLQYTRSGKGPQSQFPYGKIHLHGVPANIILEESKATIFKKSGVEDFNMLVSKQVSRIQPFIADMKDLFLLKYIENVKKEKLAKLKVEEQNKLIVSQALEKMNAFCKKNTL